MNPSALVPLITMSDSASASRMCARSSASVPGPSCEASSAARSRVRFATRMRAAGLLRQRLRGQLAHAPGADHEHRLVLDVAERPARQRDRRRARRIRRAARCSSRSARACRQTSQCGRRARARRSAFLPSSPQTWRPAPAPGSATRQAPSSRCPQPRGTGARRRRCAGRT